MKVYLNGAFLEDSEAKISVFDHGFLYGDGVFETLQYDHGEILNFQKHMERLQHSAKTVMLQVPDINFEHIINSLIEQNNYSKSRIRITLTRGENHFQFTTCEHPTLLIVASPYIEKRQNFYQGTKTCSIQIERPLPEIKTTQILPSILAQQKMYKLACDECFFVDHKGQITEGSYSNFFAIKDGVIYTPPKEVCLEGTIRKQLFEIAEIQKNFTIVEKTLFYKDLSHFDEAFWTNAIVHIAPIQSLDDVQFTCVGPITQKVIQELEK